MKKIILIFIFFIFSRIVYADIDSTNSGFLTSSPVNDPSATSVTIVNTSRAAKFTSPSDAGTITAIGYWADATSTSASLQMGIYDHNSGSDKPGTLVGSTSTITVPASSGWKEVSGLSISISSSTVYWIAVAVGNVGTDAIDGKTGTGRRSFFNPGAPPLPSTWSASSTESTNTLAVYVIYTTSSGSRRIFLIE